MFKALGTSISTVSRTPVLKGKQFLVGSICWLLGVVGVWGSFQVFQSADIGIRTPVLLFIIAALALGTAYSAKVAAGKDEVLEFLDLFTYLKEGFLWPTAFPFLAEAFGFPTIEINRNGEAARIITETVIQISTLLHSLFT
ncbi:MAG: hypothetical protein KIS85_05015 [Anaerolineales bacterium]|nr:hypothetical protein [Anaerolineales bacterium]